MSSTPHEQPRSELRRRRDRLAEEVAELHWALGGLTYEMAIRDHFRLDVLLRRAAMLQERDAELAEVERLLHMQESSVVGNCPSCGAVRSRGAVFCWQCGGAVMERSEVPSEKTDATTVEMSAVASSGDRSGTPPIPAPAIAERSKQDDPDAFGRQRDLGAGGESAEAETLGSPIQVSP